jgi:hypothetical protein
MKRMSALLGLNRFKPRVLPWRLIKMTMNRYIAVFDFWSTYDYLSFNALSYITLSISKQFLTYPSSYEFKLTKFSMFGKNIV